MSETSTTARDDHPVQPTAAVLQILFGFVGLLLIAGGLLTRQLVRRDIWMSGWVKAGGNVVRFADDASPYVTPGACTIYNCEGSDGTITTWR